MQFSIVFTIIATITAAFAVSNLTDIERASLLAGPPLSCFDSNCIIQWATEVNAHGLTTDLEQIYATGLPPQLAAYFEIDADTNLTMISEFEAINAVTPVPGDNLKTVCCAQCNQKKMSDLCITGSVFPFLMGLCVRESHRCCMQTLGMGQRCHCGCIGKNGCQQVELCKLST